jgi:hypothetical protein
MRESTIKKKLEKAVDIVNEQHTLMKQMRSLGLRVAKLGKDAKEILLELDEETDEEQYLTEFSEAAADEGFVPLDEDLVAEQLFDTEVRFDSVHSSIV